MNLKSQTKTDKLTHESRPSGRCSEWRRIVHDYEQKLKTQIFDNKSKMKIINKMTDLSKYDVTFEISVF